MWIQRAQEAFHDFRIFVIQFFMDAPTQEGKGLDEPFDMRILAFISI